MLIPKNMNRADFDAVIKQVSFDECAAIRDRRKDSEHQKEMRIDFMDNAIMQSPALIASIVGKIIERLGLVRIEDN